MNNDTNLEPEELKKIYGKRNNHISSEIHLIYIYLL